MIYKSFTEMPVWQKAHSLAVEVFNLTIGLPGSEDYGLTSQIRKSSNGAAACIAEGFGRSTKKTKLNFYILELSELFLHIIPISFLKEFVLLPMITGKQGNDYIKQYLCS